MKTSSRILGLFAVMLTGVSLLSAQTVLAPAKRQQALERGKALVATREITPVAVDPFYSTAFAETVAAARGARPGTGTVTPPVEGNTTTAPVVPTGPRNDHDLLVAIATSLKPSGLIFLGDQASLSFGQKRVKAGGTLTITFEGNQYILEVVTIDRINFTLRLNREEFTRTIK